MTRRAGFTLLELLVALAILAVVGAGLAGAMRLGAQTYTRARQLDSDMSSDSRGLFRRLASRATSPNLLTPFPKEFRGNAHELRFVTLAPFGFARDAAGLRVDLSVSGGALVASILPFDDDGEILTEYQSVLQDNADNVVISYFADGEWLDAWDQTSGLPALVSIDVPGKSAQAWPDFTIELVYRD